MINLLSMNSKRTVNFHLLIWVISITVFCKFFIESAALNPSSHESVLEIPSSFPDTISNQAEMPSRLSFAQYKKARNNFLLSEQSRALGSKIKLNKREILANEVFQVVKKAEMDKGYADPSTFAPAKHIFHTLNDIKNRDMFQLIQKMPKGGVLHAHGSALTSREFLISLTYWPDLWILYDTNNDDISFKFSRKQPEDIDGRHWSLVSTERATKGKEKFDEDLKKYFSLYTDHPEADYPDNNAVWKYFSGLFARVTPFLSYVPVWKAYYKQALKEFYEDGVQYLEFRCGLPDLYDLDGKIYKDADVAKVYMEGLEEFRAENPDFIGSKLIYAQSRKSDDATFARYMQLVVELTKKFPKFIVGFDIQSHENIGRPMIDFAEQLLKLPKNINFYFHAGETNWNGMKADENLIDAILLGTKRIGHGYAILKHPKVLEAVRNNSIAIEINPISNQVLTLVDKSFNHPGSYLFAEDYPVVVSSDDRAFFETAPLSHDFYIAFMGIASAHADLRTLKQLAINSLVYSAMDDAERKVAFTKWQRKWDEYIEWVIAQRQKYNL